MNLKTRDERREAFLADKIARCDGRRGSIEIREMVGGRYEWQSREPETGESVQYQDFETDAHGEWFEPNYMASSDYSGSLVEESNRKTWLEEIDPESRCTVVLYGSHGTESIAVKIARLTPEQVETLEKLADYPLIDEEAHSNLEIERQQEDWESWARSDWKRALEDEFNVDLDDMAQADLDASFWQNQNIQDRRGDWFFAEGISTCFRFERCVKAIDRETLVSIDGVVDLDLLNMSNDEQITCVELLREARVLMMTPRDSETYRIDAARWLDRVDAILREYVDGHGEHPVDLAKMRTLLEGAA